MRIGYNVGLRVFCSLCDWKWEAVTYPECERALLEHLGLSHHRIVVHRVDVKDGKHVYEGPRYSREER